MVVNLGPDFVKVWVGGLAYGGASPPVVSHLHSVHLVPRLVTSPSSSPRFWSLLPLTLSQNLYKMFLVLYFPETSDNPIPLSAREDFSDV